MAAHLKHYTQNNKNSLLLYRTMSNVPKHDQYLFFLDLRSFPHQPYHSTLKQRSYFVGSTHGLLCLSDGRYVGHTSRTILWNPFLSKIIKLPTSMADTRNLRYQTSVLGFGYNSYHNDHRVVKISFNRGKSGNDGFRPLVEVYSVCDRVWRIIRANYLVDKSIHGVSSSHCFVNGVIHWPTRLIGSNSSMGERIVLFDVVKETFRMIKFPRDLAIKKRSEHTVGIFEYNSKLAVSHVEYHLTGFYRYGTCKIWIRRREECWEPWYNIFTVLLGTHHIRNGPIEYMRNGNVFGFAKRNDKMLLLCSRFDIFSELGVHQDKSTKFAAFTESLVLLDQNTDDCTDDAPQRHISHST